MLPSISNDDDFVGVCTAIFGTVEHLAEDKAQVHLVDALYHLLPLASQRNRRVYLSIIQEALPIMVKYLPPAQVRPVLVFLEAQWQEQLTMSNE